MRHPVYGDTIVIGLGWSFADAPLGLVPTALLAVLFDLKARREETWLIERFPDYALYRTRTPRRCPGSTECHEGGFLGGTLCVSAKSDHEGGPFRMLHAGLDLSRKRLDYCLLDEAGERVEVGKAPPDGDGLAGFVPEAPRDAGASAYVTKGRTTKD